MAWGHNGIALGTFSGVGASPPKPPPLVELQRNPSGLRFFLCICPRDGVARRESDRFRQGRFAKSRADAEIRRGAWFPGPPSRVQCGVGAASGNGAISAPCEGFGECLIRLYLPVLPAAWPPATQACVGRRGRSPMQGFNPRVFAREANPAGRRLQATRRRAKPAVRRNRPCATTRAVHENSRIPG